MRAHRFGSVVTLLRSRADGGAIRAPREAERPRRLLGACALVAVLLVEGAGSALAAGVVGDGTPQSCTGAALAAALQGGGLVTFACGAEQTTVVVEAAVIGSGVSATVDGGGRITLDAEQLRRHFLVLEGGELTLRNISLGRGSSSEGGAIRNHGTVLLERVSLANNRTDGGGSGGAIFNAASLTVYDSTFFGNLAAGNGGALFSEAGTAVIRRCLLDFNWAESGGGIFVGSGTLVLSNSTLTRGRSESGGGLFVDGDGEALIDGTTFDQNNADHGGALFREAAVVVGNSVFSRSFDRGQVSESLECDGTGAAITSTGGNLAEDGSCQFGEPTDRNNTAPLLADVAASNGGPTRTILPLPGSPLIDGGVQSGCEEVDQRGAARPFDGDGDGIAICDIGAVEVPEPASTLASGVAAIALAAAARLRRTRTRSACGRETRSCAASRRS